MEKGVQWFHGRHPQSPEGRVRRGSAEPAERPSDADGGHTTQAGAKSPSTEADSEEARLIKG